MIDEEGSRVLGGEVMFVPDNWAPLSPDEAAEWCICDDCALRARVAELEAALAAAEARAERLEKMLNATCKEGSAILAVQQTIIEVGNLMAEEAEKQKARAERLAAYAFCADTLRRCPAGGPSQALWSRRYEHAKAALQPGDLGETGETK